MVSEEATRDFVVEYGLLKFNVAEVFTILVSAMDKISDTPATVTGMQKTDSTRSLVMANWKFRAVSFEIAD